MVKNLDAGISPNWRGSCKLWSARHGVGDGPMGIAALAGHHHSTRLQPVLSREAGGGTFNPHPSPRVGVLEEEGSESLRARFLGELSERAAGWGRVPGLTHHPFTLTFQEGGLHHRHHQQHLPPGLSRTVLPQRRWNSRKGGASPWVGNLTTTSVLGCSRTPDSQSPALSHFVSPMFLLPGG